MGAVSWEQENIYNKKIKLSQFLYVTDRGIVTLGLDPPLGFEIFFYICGIFEKKNIDLCQKLIL